MAAGAVNRGAMPGAPRGGDGTSPRSRASGGGLRRIFAEVAPRYEPVNRVLTFGLDRRFRRRAVRMVEDLPGGLWLDVCTGTGEFAALLRRVAPADTLVVAADFCLPMLTHAGRRPGNAGRLVAAQAAALPFPDNSLDLVAISFATRNVSSSPEGLEATLREFHRVLRPGGCFLNLETSRPPAPLLRRIFHGYVRLVVPPVGGLLSGSRAGYAYLSRTIATFHDAEAFANVVRGAGFAEVSFKRLVFGAVAVHLARKAEPARA